jgi:putative phosphoesterase
MNRARFLKSARHTDGEGRDQRRPAVNSSSSSSGLSDIEGDLMIIASNTAKHKAQDRRRQDDEGDRNPRDWTSGRVDRSTGLMIRVAILADTRGHLDPRVEALVADCDLAVHGGDIGNAGVLERLRPRQEKVIAVTGNNDSPRKWPPEQQRFLHDLREHVDLRLPGGRLAIIHGHQIAARNRHERLRRRFPHARAIIYGHSHRLIADRDREPWVLNPGAAGRARSFGGPSCIVLDATEHHWELRIERCESSKRHGR